MKISRKFTKDGSDPFASVKWVRRSSKISNPDGSVVFEMKDAEVPETWSQLATDIMVSKYFRKAGVPDGKGGTGPEKSARQVIHRLAGCWRHWGETHGYFDTSADAKAFYDEMVYMMVHQMCAPNSPQWFNTGLHWAYGISGPAQGHWVVDPKTGQARLADDAYSHPQPHACFIQSITDDLVNEGGIMDLWVREARLFKYGSGTGTNFSNLRAEGEPLSGGGRSSGLMSWLKIGDRAASAIKSGGTTRRAAKMVCLDMDHPDIQTFINWKVREEIKVQALVEGLKRLKRHDESVARTAERLNLNLDYDFNGEAYLTVSGQNSNNSVRIPDEFFEALDAGRPWETHWRTDRATVARTFDSKALWDDMCFAAWRCADPGVQFDTTINAWHTCPGGGRINASNPCSEYMFLDNTACNLASLNVLKFYDATGRTFDIERYEHAIDLWTMVLEISVLMAAFPSREIAELSHRYRTLGLGYANLGAMLMQAGIPYDSDEARAVGAMLTSILTGRAYRMSALMAAEHGPFSGSLAGGGADAKNMLRVIRNHRRAAMGVARDRDEWEGLNPRTRPVPIDHALARSGRVGIANADDLLIRAVSAWNDALSLGEKHGYRNAQVTVIAPTGTIGLLMDCDTTGVEPDFSLVKFKKLAGGGYFKIANESVEPALVSLGYTADQVGDILTYLLGALTLNVPMPASAKGAKPGMTLAGWLSDRGLSDQDLAGIERSLPGVFELSFAFTGWGVSEATLIGLGLDPAESRREIGFNLLKKLGLRSREIDHLNTLVCGTQTVEGAPHLKSEHLSVFDCANKCGKSGQRYIAPTGHIRMMAAAQPFISGAISKTINLPTEATPDQIAECYRMSWELGLKANALYRDNCKLSQPLSSTSGSESSDSSEDELEEQSAREEVAEAVASLAAAAVVLDAPKVAERQVEIVYRPMRRRLPDTRRSITHKFNVAGHEGYVTVGLYEDCKPGELFIQMSKEGSTIGGLMDALGTATSVALQYGVPVESMVAKFSHQRFEPAGMTENRDIPFAKSLVDYIFRWIGMEFIEGYREAHAPRRGSEDHASGAGAGSGGGGGSLGELNPVDRLGMSDRVSAVRAQGARGEDAGSSQEDSRWTRTPSNGSKFPADGPSGMISAEVIVVESTRTIATSAAGADTLTRAMESVGDAPPCDTCGTITVRSGTCYKCLNCGASLGCS
ncbi:MAG: adenosylcobalamin-dependent ribonucleoside-diphosphate reductase [Phycisphaerae bacterium]|nr:adenosylcobalamin-dependent ribonucleoside-diphosphate reductase [Phycisphaerae bacterium]